MTDSEVGTLRRLVDENRRLRDTLQESIDLQHRRDISFILFAVTVVGNVLTILFDWWLAYTGREMITWFTYDHEWLTPILVGWQLIGAAALVYHLVWCRPKGKT